MMDTEKRDLLAEHAEGLLDVGKSILESYSRVLESLASSIIARIDDRLNVDELSKLQTTSSPAARTGTSPARTAAAAAARTRRCPPRARRTRRRTPRRASRRRSCPARQRSAGPCWSTAGRTTPMGPEPIEQRRPRLTGPARGCQARLDASAASAARPGVRADGENRVERARERERS
ncbi:hypothetical protein GQ55_9G114900 [Panicum hallii var. hallii]|uniref:PRONE domain-containing protein n=1 Tax=Panicum hallii var. hallii TaxID=1504633 RepID=A0A2T7C260_9POAL|nr:hypothetical protein GQ55_9G114900 [Panicum hallii var. hallii]